MFSLFRRQRIDPHAALKSAIGDAALPSFPAVVLQALRVLRDPDGTVGEVGDLLASDPGLSVKVLQIANSAGAGAGRRIGNVRHAVAMAGLARVESIVLAAGVQSALPSRPRRGYEASRFWRVAARRAATARALAMRLHPARAVESFTAALLQDMALPILADRRGDEYGRVLEAWHGGEGELDALERDAFGWDHGQVATWLCASWELPEELAMAIGGHHGGEVADQCPPAVALVGHLTESNADPGTDALVEDAVSRFGLPSDDALRAVNEGMECGDELARLFS